MSGIEYSVAFNCSGEWIGFSFDIRPHEIHPTWGPVLLTSKAGDLPSIQSWLDEMEELFFDGFPVEE